MAARSLIVLASLVLVGTSACSDRSSSDEGGTETSTTSMVPPSSPEISTENAESTATSTTVMVTPTLPPELDAKYPVKLAEGVAGPDTQDIAVWSPDAEGSWPIALILHGLGSQGIHYGETASLLASQGVVVFAPDYRSTLIPTPEWKSAFRDSECAYRHVRTIAADYGGDINQPITIVGHSIGATVGLAMVLDEFNFSNPDGDFDACPADVPRPDQLVALSGCHYKSHLGETFPFDPASYGWTHHDARIELVVGSDDDVCEAWQSEDAATELLADGYESVDLTIIDDADHFSVIFTGYDNGPWYGPDVEWFSLPNDPGGIATVQTILDTINAPISASADDETDVFSFADDDLCEWVSADKIAEFVAAEFEWDGTATEIDTRNAVGCYWELTSETTEPATLGFIAPTGLTITDDVEHYDPEGEIEQGVIGSQVLGHPHLSDGVAYYLQGFGPLAFGVPEDDRWFVVDDLPNDEPWPMVNEDDAWFGWFGVADRLIDELGWMP